jgi:plastocyanin
MTSMRRLIVLLVVLTACAWHASAALACGGTPVRPTFVLAFYSSSGPPSNAKFSPNHPRLVEGGQVIWSFNASDGAMTATDSTGMGLFNSGRKSQSSSNPDYKHTFQAAGGYPFVSTTHPEAKGVVSVGLSRSPGSGSLSTSFTLTLACAAHPGFLSDVEIRPPHGSWGWWRYGVSTTTVTFMASRTGTYQFRARLRKTANNKFSNFSPLVLVGVH